MDHKAKGIAFEYEGKEYNLGFTADSLKQMERGGFKFAKMDESILTAPEELFYGAFIAHHKEVPRKKREEIFRALTNTEEGDDQKQTIAEALGILLSQAIEELNTKQGNVPWRMV